MLILLNTSTKLGSDIKRCDFKIAQNLGDFASKQTKQLCKWHKKVLILLNTSTKLGSDIKRCDFKIAQNLVDFASKQTK